VSPIPKCSSLISTVANTDSCARLLLPAKSSAVCDMLKFYIFQDPIKRANLPCYGWNFGPGRRDWPCCQNQNIKHIEAILQVLWGLEWFPNLSWSQVISLLVIRSLPGETDNNKISGKCTDRLLQSTNHGPRYNARTHAAHSIQSQHALHL